MSTPQKLQTDIVKHVLSCDCDPLVERFIKGVARPDFFVRQLDDMRDSIVLDAWSGKHVPRPTATSTCCGWVCHTVPLPQLSLVPGASTCVRNSAQ